MSSAKRRRHFTGAEKVAILRRHLVEKVPVSDLCEEHGIHPTLFYRWQKDWFEQGGESALRKRRMVRIGNPTCPSEPRPWGPRRLLQRVALLRIDNPRRLWLARTVEYG